MQRRIRIRQIDVQFVLAFHLRIQCTVEIDDPFLTRHPETRVCVLRIDIFLILISHRNKDQFHVTFVHRRCKTGVMKRNMCIKFMTGSGFLGKISIVQYKAVSQAVFDLIKIAVAHPLAEHLRAVGITEIRPMVFLHLFDGISSSGVFA